MSEKNPLILKVEETKKDLWLLKSKCLKEGEEIYFQRALINILENKELSALSKTPAGVSSIIRCISNALQMGLQIGGQIPQAYIVAMPTKDGIKATLIPTLDGYRFIALSDPPVLKDISISPVYEKEVDGLKINKPTGEVNHFAYIGKDRGEIVGVYAILTDLDGVKKADWMTRTEIETVRNNHSSSYKAFLAKKISRDKCAWETDFDMMAIKTAGKRFLSPYAGLKEGLAMALAASDDIEEDTRDITDRVGSKLDNIIDAEIIEDKPTPEKKTEKKELPKEDMTGNEEKKLFSGKDLREDNTNIPY